MTNARNHPAIDPAPPLSPDGNAEDSDVMLDDDGPLAEENSEPIRDVAASHRYPPFFKLFYTERALGRGDEPKVASAEREEHSLLIVAALAPDCEKKLSRKWQKCDVFIMQHFELANDFNGVKIVRQNRFYEIFEKILLKSPQSVDFNIVYLTDT